MKGAAYQGAGKIEVIEVERPAPGPGQLLVRTRACGICGSDLHAVKFGTEDLFGEQARLVPGSIMGHEFSAEVVEAGPGVEGFKAGDLVVSLPYATCGTCEACASNQEILCAQLQPVGLGGLPGGYGEYMVVGAKQTLAVPAGTNHRRVALTEPLAVGLHAVRSANLQPQDQVVIFGAGPIGLVTLLWVKQAGVASVIVSEPAPGRREQARALGADHVIDPREESPLEASMRLNNALPGVVFECVGVPGLIQQAIDLVAPMGRVMVVGVCMEDDTFKPLVGILKQATVSFQLGYTPEEFAESMQAIASGKVDTSPLITDVIGVDEVPAMFEKLAQPTTQIKVLVEFP